MRILLINHYAGSPDMGMEFRPYYLARHWQRMGHKVMIVAAGFSHLRQKNPKLLRGYERGRVEGVDYLFIKTPPYSSNGYDRLINMGAFLSGVMNAAAPLSDNFAPDVVLSSSTYPFDAYPARMIAQRAGGIHIHEVHDLWPMTLIDLYGFSPLNPAMVSMQTAEDFALSKADKVVSMLPGVGMYMQERGLDSSRFICVPNGVEADEPVSPPPNEIVDAIWHMRTRYRYNVLYLGGFAVANGVDDFIRLAAFRPEVLFIAVGGGSQKDELIGKAAQSGISNVLFFPPVPHEKVYATLCLADVLYIGAKKSKLYRYGVGMNKFFEYMASGRPVLSAVEATNDPVREAGCGLSVPAQDAKAAAVALDKLLALDNSGRNEMGRRGIEYAAKHHNYSVLAKKYIKIMEDVSCEKTRIF